MAINRSNIRLFSEKINMFVTFTADRVEDIPILHTSIYWAAKDMDRGRETLFSDSTSPEWHPVLFAFVCRGRKIKLPRVQLECFAVLLGMRCMAVESDCTPDQQQHLLLYSGGQNLMRAHNSQGGSCVLRERGTEREREGDTETLSREYKNEHTLYVVCILGRGDL